MFKKLTLILSIFIFSNQLLAQNNDYNDVKKRFDLMCKNSDLNIEFNDLIYNQIKRYLRESNMDKVIAVFNFYKPMFDMKFYKYNVPTDLKYLSIIESRLNTLTISSAGAVGMWQIMPETGKELRLRKDKFVNDWLNPIASTDASARYLYNANKSLNDWNLTLVSYNCGIGNVQKAIRKSGSKNIWKVYQFLPSETRDYIIRFYAIKYVDTYGDYHNFYPKLMKYNYNDTEVIFYDGRSNIVKDNWFYFLNPHILTNVIPKGVPITLIKK